MTHRRDFYAHMRSQSVIPEVVALENRGARVLLAKFLVSREPLGGVPGTGRILGVVFL